MTDTEKSNIRSASHVLMRTSLHHPIVDFRNLRSPFSRKTRLGFYLDALEFCRKRDNIFMVKETVAIDLIADLKWNYLKGWNCDDRDIFVDDV